MPDQVYLSRESGWLVETSANFFAGRTDKIRYYREAYAYTTVNPHLALWQAGYYRVTT